MLFAWHLWNDAELSIYISSVELVVTAEITFVSVSSQFSSRYLIVRASVFLGIK